MLCWFVCAQSEKRLRGAVLCYIWINICWLLASIPFVFGCSIRDLFFVCSLLHSVQSVSCQPSRVLLTQPPTSMASLPSILIGLVVVVSIVSADPTSKAWPAIEGLPIDFAANIPSVSITGSIPEWLSG